MILSKANQVGSGVEVIGILTHDLEFDCMRIRVKKQKGSAIYSIVPSTLKHSFDNGKTWHTEDEIKEALEAKSKSCENCKHYEYNISYAEEGRGWCLNNINHDADIDGNEGNIVVDNDFYCNKHEPK